MVSVMRGMLRLLLLLFACAVWGVAQAAVYTWVDDQGVRHYSDHPVAQQAETVDLNTSQPAPRPASQQTQSDAAATAPQRLTILRPQPSASLDSAEGLVAVAVNIDGGLGANEQLMYYLDGQTVANSPTQALQFKLMGLPAGPHALQVALLVGGQEASRSDPIAFTVQLVPATATQQSQTASQ